MRKMISSAFLCILTLCAYADNLDDIDKNSKNDVLITGHVIESVSRENLPYITIGLKGTTTATMTDESGRFSIRNIPSGKYSLIASAVGYSTLDTVINVVGGQTLSLDLELEEEALNLNEVVVSATKNETNRKETATIVTVMSTKLFETNAASTMSETMSFNSGLRMESNCSNCGFPQLKINGLDGKYSQILLDSRAVMSSLAGVYGLEQVPVSMIERVEVIRGGGSALFGSSAIGGIVNIITKEPLRNSAYVSHTTNVTDKGTMDHNTSLNGSFVSEDRKAGLYVFGMVKHRDAYDSNDDGFSDSPKLESETVGFRGYYKTSMFTKLTAEYHHIHEFRRGGDRIETTQPHEADIAEQLNHSINGGGLTFDAYTRNQKHRFQVYSSLQGVNRRSYYGTEQDPNAYGRTKDLTSVSGAQYIYHPDKFLFCPANITFGGEFTYNGLSDHTPGYNRNLEQNTHVGGAFLQSEWTGNKLNVIIGARLDKHSKIRHAVVSPRANIKYTPAEWIGLRAGYSSGYLAPQAYDEDLHVNAAGGDVSLIELDPGLRPEYSHSLNLSADTYFNMGRVQANVLVEGFYTNLKDVFSLTKDREDENGNIIFKRVNASGAVVRGLNAEAKLGIPRKFEVQLGYTFQRGSYKDPYEWSETVAPQKRMFRSPDHYGYFTSNITLLPGFTLSLFGNITGTMLVQHLAGYIEQDCEVWTPAFFDGGFKLDYDIRISRSITLNVFGGIKNVFNQFQKDVDMGVMKDAAYVYGPSAPRNYFAGLKFSM